ALKQMELFGDGGIGGPSPGVPPTVDDVLDTLEARLRRKLSGPEVHPIWRTLADRLEDLRRARMASARDSVEFLKRMLELARQFVGAERAEADGRLEAYSVLDPDRGAL